MSELDAVVLERIRKAARRYAATGAGTIERMEGVPFKKLRTGDWQAILDEDETTVYVMFAGHRSDVYKKFLRWLRRR